MHHLLRNTVVSWSAIIASTREDNVA
jgi:hypothetical protein